MGTAGASWLCSCAVAAACHLLPAPLSLMITELLQNLPCHLHTNATAPVSQLRLRQGSCALSPFSVTMRT